MDRIVNKSTSGKVEGRETKKTKLMQKATSNPEHTNLTTNQGLKINDDQNSLKAFARGPSLLEDFILREKITHFDHERIPERVVHARGTGAHGFFKVYRPMTAYTKAHFLQDPGVETPVFVRFSTVAGSRGSTDLARDVRGFAVKFYTEDGVFDLVGNNMPVFFIQDAMKFPDLIHAVKPEPHHDMPQAASAHDTFWDFISLMPESTHMIMWLMSDRALPRSYRMMEGFGVHTFRFVNEKEQSVFVKFHWKPLLGTHSLLWDEAQKISGIDPDYHRRDLWEAIEAGTFPEWELAVQMIGEDQAEQFDFDILDPTKLVPEELVPVQRIGKLTLSRNPDNFFAETEQVAFHPGHLVPGIDFTNDPLLQGRLFSYTDTQLSRLGGPNFHEFPINKSIAPVHNHQRDGRARHEVVKSRVSYEPNSLGGGCPFQAKAFAGGFTSFPAQSEGAKVRARGEKFFEHFSQAKLFFQSQTITEKNHIVEALRFELGKVETKVIRERVLYQLAHVDQDFARNVAHGLGISVPQKMPPLNMSVPADHDPQDYQSLPAKEPRTLSPALSLMSSVPDTIKSRVVAVLLADGFDEKSLDVMQNIIEKHGGKIKIVAPHLGTCRGMNGVEVKADFSLLTARSVLFDAVFVPGGMDSVTALTSDGAAIRFVLEAYKHCKAIAVAAEGVELLRRSGYADFSELEMSAKSSAPEEGLILGSELDLVTTGNLLVAAMAKHRAWHREPKTKLIPV